MLSASVGVAMIGLGIVWPLVPVYAVELGAGGFQVGLIIASFNLARTLFLPPMDNLGLTSIFVAGGILIIIGTVLIAVILKGYGKNEVPVKA